MPPRDALGSRDLQRAVALTERIERVLDQRVVGQEGLRSAPGGRRW